MISKVDMSNHKVLILITGTSKGIGKYLAEYYSSHGYQVIGCSRSEVKFSIKNYQHFCVDVSDEKSVKNLFRQIRKSYGRLDILINNAGIASMNHSLLTPISTVQKILDTNVIGAFLFSRESAKLMKIMCFKRTSGAHANRYPKQIERNRELHLLFEGSYQNM